ncbi:PAS domain-containing protein [Aestuariispira insulae]|uniref:PAS domain-containing protein n=1 Tax=Aestuariispira insulae TaxID=1461337 RepID=A0A3D9HPW5_9PROT|nr:PAS domain-containing protein [Aestuariispira insulae]RED50946.1 PAS domain-containing protein [Aestuariispira insulae]
MTGIINTRIDLDKAIDGVREILDYWQSKRKDDGFPGKSDIEPWDIQEKLGRICLLEVQQQPLDFIYRLDGSNIASAVTVDMTGRPVSEITPEIYSTAVTEALSASLDEEAPTLWHVDIDIPPANYGYQRLVLPLTGGKAHIQYLMTFSYCLDTTDGIFPWNRSYGKPG